MNGRLRRCMPHVALVTWVMVFVWVTGLWSTASAEPHEILNVSYDVSREFYKEYNAAFANYWHQKTRQPVTIRQSHGGSTAQARAVLAGLEADVVTMNQDSDIAILAQDGVPVAKNWRERLPHHSIPFTSTIVFLVTRGNANEVR